MTPLIHHYLCCANFCLNMQMSQLVLLHCRMGMQESPHYCHALRTSRMTSPHQVWYVLFAAQNAAQGKLYTSEFSHTCIPAFKLHVT